MKTLFDRSSGQPQLNRGGRLQRFISLTLVSWVFLGLGLSAKGSVYYNNDTPYNQVVTYRQIIDLDTRGGKIYRNEVFSVLVAPGQSVSYFDHSVSPGSATGTFTYSLVSVAPIE